MRLPTLLSHRKSNAYKNQFGHVLVLAGSARMLGAAALSSLAAMRSGAGLVTLGVPKSLNVTAQKKIANTVMTLPLPETSSQTLAANSFAKIKKAYPSYNAVAIGPGLSLNPSTQRLALKVIETSPIPLVIDADALNTVSRSLKSLNKTTTPKILTPHPGEMARLTGGSKKGVEADRKAAALTFAKKYQCVLLLKGAKTIVAAPDGKFYTNTTGNAGMATAGSGDVLTGMIAAFLAQGLSAFDAAKYGAYLHGKAGDLAAKANTQLSMIASDIIDHIPEAIKKTRNGT